MPPGAAAAEDRGIEGGALNAETAGAERADAPLRPPRAEVEPAALSLIRRYGASIMGTARRYSATPEDAEDAYQRGLEILLTKAPSTREEDLVPWLKTVVKHEAFALRRQRERLGGGEEEVAAEPARGGGTEERAERFERLRIGAEAMRRLKPQEIRCLVLRAEGYSYRQICEETGWTYTKVNRCLTEGRRSFLEGVRGIESGAECERLAPLLSALADGEATAEQMVALRPHLRGCPACRAALREYHAAPARVAALLPPIGLIAWAGGGSAAGGSAGGGGGMDSVAAWLHERASAVSLRFQELGEVASAQKVAAVAASTAALAGGGVATVRGLEPDTEPPERAGLPVAASVELHAMPTPPRALLLGDEGQPPYDQDASRSDSRTEGPAPSGSAPFLERAEPAAVQAEPVQQEFGPEFGASGGSGSEFSQEYGDSGWGTSSGAAGGGGGTGGGGSGGGAAPSGGSAEFSP